MSSRVGFQTARNTLLSTKRSSGTAVRGRHPHGPWAPAVPARRSATDALPAAARSTPMVANRDIIASTRRRARAVRLRGRSTGTSTNHVLAGSRGVCGGPLASVQPGPDAVVASDAGDQDDALAEAGARAHGREGEVDDDGARLDPAPALDAGVASAPGVVRCREHGLAHSQALEVRARVDDGGLPAAGRGCRRE